jgi:hypothetical protein
MTLKGILDIMIFRQIRSFQIYSLQGVVNSVDQTKRTCEVKVDETIYSNILLQAVNTFSTGFVLFPKVNSVVTITFTSKETAFISQTTELSKVICDVPIFEVKNGSSGLKKTLSDLIDAINLMTVPTGTGPSGTPINAATFTDIKTDLANYLI